MRPAEQGFLLLTSHLGDPDRKPLTVSQFRVLAERVQTMRPDAHDRDLQVQDLKALGYGEEMAGRILSLLNETDALWHYLRKAEKAGCVPLSRIHDRYPNELLDRLGWECPGCLWVKGDLSLLATRKIALVGSRDILPDNRSFAYEAGVQAAKQGYTLVSGNARGADRIAQKACLDHGGKVISVVADELADKEPHERILYLSEEGFDLEFSAQRALSRNRVIHALGAITLVAQSDLRGGTWDGTVKNLRYGWSSVFCFDDGSEATKELVRMGAGTVTRENLRDIRKLRHEILSLFDQ